MPFGRSMQKRARGTSPWLLFVTMLVGCGSEAPVGSQLGTQGSSAGTAGTTGSSALGDKSAPTSSNSTSTVVSKNLGTACLADGECKSSICKAITPGQSGGPKVCSECREHQSCVSQGLGRGCLFVERTGFYSCSEGYIGDPCETQAHCEAGFMCALLNLGDNESTKKFCSQCETHVDCPQEERRNCIARYNPTGMMYNQCLPDGARQKGEVCFPCATGNRECDGLCVMVSNQDTESKGLCIGVCGECASDSDCPKGQICKPPILDFKNTESDPPHTPSRCVVHTGP